MTIGIGCNGAPDADEQQYTGRDPVPPGIERSVEVDDRRNNALQQYAKHRADPMAGTARQQRAADNRTRYNFQFSALQRKVPTGFYRKQLGNTCRYEAEAAENVNQPLGIVPAGLYDGRKGDHIHQISDKFTYRLDLTFCFCSALLYISKMPASSAQKRTDPVLPSRRHPRHQSALHPGRIP